MQIHVGIQIRGRPGMVVNRPKGSGDYVIVHFLEPVFLDHTRSVRAPADTCIFYLPDSPTYIEADDLTIYNNFIHISADLLESIPHYPLPHDEPFLLSDSGSVDSHLSRIQREWVRHDAYWEDAIRLCIAELFLDLARNVAAQSRPRLSGQTERLKEVRLKVHSAPQDQWTVDKMAQLVGLRSARFSTLYRNIFGRSPMEDLILRRLEIAKFYLVNSTMRVSEVAEVAGFTNPYYFSRCFSRRAGCSPSEFRRRDQVRWP